MVSKRTEWICSNTRHNNLACIDSIDAIIHLLAVQNQEKYRERCLRSLGSLAFSLPFINAVIAKKK